MERAVGFFVLGAILLLMGVFGIYIYHLAKDKGWFIPKATFYTGSFSATGLKKGDPVKLMGTDVGRITWIETQPPDELFNVYVEFEVRAPYFGYLCEGSSQAMITPADFLGKRTLEVTKGTNWLTTHVTWDIREYEVRDILSRTNLRDYLVVDTFRATNGDIVAKPPDSLSKDILRKLEAQGVRNLRLADRKNQKQKITAVWDPRTDSYQPFTPQTKPYFLPPEESPALTEKLEGLITEVERALTNHMDQILTNAVSLSEHADKMLLVATPLVSNLVDISGNLKNPKGSMGEWLIPADFQNQLLTTLTNANVTMVTANSAITNANVTLTSAHTNLLQLIQQMDAPMRNLSGIISNLNLQVQANTNFVGEVSSLIVHVDGLIEGFKRHWLLRSAFKEKPTNAPPRKPLPAPPMGGKRPF